MVDSLGAMVVLQAVTASTWWDGSDETRCKTKTATWGSRSGDFLALARGRSRE